MDVQSAQSTRELLESLREAIGLQPMAPEMGPILDATGRCIARFGVSRMTAADVCAEAGISRATFYRRVESAPQIVALYLLREMYGLTNQLVAGLQPPVTPEKVASGLLAAYQLVSSNQAIAKIIETEPELVGGLLLRHSGNLVPLATGAIVTVLKRGVTDGTLRKVNPQLTAEWLSRLFISLLTTPPSTKNIEAYIHELVVPWLQPA